MEFREPAAQMKNFLLQHEHSLDSFETQALGGEFCDLAQSRDVLRGIEPIAAGYPRGRHQAQAVVLTQGLRMQPGK